MGVSYDPVNAVECGKLGRGTLRIAACDENLAAGILAMNPADDFSQLGVSGGGYCASVEQGHVAGLRPGSLVPTFIEQLLLKGGAIGLVDTASEIKNTKGTHFTSIVVGWEGNAQPFEARILPLNPSTVWEMACRRPENAEIRLNLNDSTRKRLSPVLS